MSTATRPGHLLDSLTETEMRRAREILAADDRTAKAKVISLSVAVTGDEATYYCGPSVPPRRARARLLDVHDVPYTALVHLCQRRVDLDMGESREQTLAAYPATSLWLDGTSRLRDQWLRSPAPPPGGPGEIAVTIRALTCGPGRTAALGRGLTIEAACAHPAVRRMRPLLCEADLLNHGAGSRDSRPWRTTVSGHVITWGPLCLHAALHSEGLTVTVLNGLCDGGGLQLAHAAIVRTVGGGWHEAPLGVGVVPAAPNLAGLTTVAALPSAQLNASGEVWQQEPAIGVYEAAPAIDDPGHLLVVATTWVRAALVRTGWSFGRDGRVTNVLEALRHPKPPKRSAGQLTGLT